MSKNFFAVYAAAVAMTAAHPLGFSFGVAVVWAFSVFVFVKVAASKKVSA